MAIVDVVKFRGSKGIKNVGDELDTSAPYLREAGNVDIDDAGLLSMRDGTGPVKIAGDSKSLWNTADRSLALAVIGGNLVAANLKAGTTTTIRTGVGTSTMGYVEVNNQVYYSNAQVYGFIENMADGTFPALSKIGGSRMTPGSIIEHHAGRNFTCVGGLIRYTAYLDYGRTNLRKDFREYPGEVTMFAAVSDGVFLSYGNTTVFLIGSGHPNDFVVKEVADYGVIPGTVKKFDASLVSSNTPLQGTAVYWESTKGPCIGFQGGLMINQALTKYEPPHTGNTGATIIRQNRKGFMQALTLIEY